jgi:hypothetical protein
MAGALNTEVTKTSDETHDAEPVKSNSYLYVIFLFYLIQVVAF